MAEPLVMVAPLAVTMVMLPVVTIAPEPPAFLKPKVLVGMRGLADEEEEDEGFLRPSSPLLRPASEGDRWMPVECVGRQLFSDTLASSVLPREMTLWPQLRFAITLCGYYICWTQLRCPILNQPEV